jgi:hypothetical protein
MHHRFWQDLEDSLGAGSRASWMVMQAVTGDYFATFPFIAYF